MLEVLTVLASDYRFREPREVPRPYWVTAGAKRASVSTPQEIASFMGKRGGLTVVSSA